MKKNKKQPEGEQRPDKTSQSEFEAFMNMVNAAGNQALADEAQEHTAQAPAQGANPIARSFTQADLERMVEAASDHFVWFRDSEKFTAEEFIKDELYLNFEDEIEPARLADFERKTLPTAEELAHFHERWRQQVTADGGNGIDHDEIPMCSAATHTLPNGRVLHVMICSTGYSFSGVRQWVEGIFETEADLWAYVNAAWTKP